MEGESTSALLFWLVVGSFGLVAIALAVMLGWGVAVVGVLVALSVVSVLVWSVSAPPAGHGPATR